MTEDQIERKVERAIDALDRLFSVTRLYRNRIDALDRLFLAGKLSQEAYDSEIVAWDKWAEQQYREVVR